MSVTPVDLSSLYVAVTTRLNVEVADRVDRLPDVGPEHLLDGVERGLLVGVQLDPARRFSPLVLDGKRQAVADPDHHRQAAAKGLEVKATPPFDRLHGLEEFHFPPEFSQKALALTDLQSLAVNAIPGEKAFYIIALKNRFPSEMQPLEKIRDKVTADYRSTQALELARKAGNSFHATLTNGLAQKKTFGELCAQAKVKTIALPPVAPETTSLPGLDPRLSLRQLQHSAMQLQPGQASNFTPTTDGGFILYLRDRLPFDEEKVKKELPEFLAKLRQYRQNQAFDQWFRRAAEQARLVIPAKENTGGLSAAEN